MDLLCLFTSCRAPDVPLEEMRPHLLSSKLLNACSEGNMDEVDVLLALPNAKDFVASANPFKRTPLHIACSKGDVELTKKLLAFEETVDAICKESSTFAKTTLNSACYEGSLPIVQLLLEHKKGRECIGLKTTHKWTAFHVACFVGNVEIVETLLRYPETWEIINEKDNVMRTAFDLAVIQKHINVILTLLKSENFLGNVDIYRLQETLHVIEDYIPPEEAEKIVKLLSITEEEAKMTLEQIVVEVLQPRSDKGSKSAADLSIRQRTSAAQ